MEEDERPDETINSACQLLPNHVYLRPEHSSSFQLPDWTPPTISINTVSHFLRFRLLHKFGPYPNEMFECEMLYLVAECIRNPDQIFVVFFEPIYESHRKIQINIEFTLENFLTIKCPNNLVLFNPVAEQVFTKPLYGLFLFASPEFKSEINFLNDPGPLEFLETEFYELDMSSIRDNIDSSPEDVTLLSEDDDDILMSLEMQIPQTNGINREQEPQSENQQNGHETPPESGVPDVASSESKINQIMQGIDDSLKTKFPNIERFIRTNIHLVDWDQQSELTLSLSDVVYPSNDVQNSCKVNVIGIIKRVISPNNVPKELIIMDEGCEKFSIKLMTGQKAMNRCPDLNATNPPPSLPPLRNGDIAFIRQLLLGQNSLSICNNSETLTTIELFHENDLIKTTKNRILSSQELKRTAELACMVAEQLISGDTDTASKHTIINLAGQYLGNHKRPNFIEIYLLVPFRIAQNSYLGDAASSLMDQIQNMTFHQEQREFNRELIKQLMDDHRIVSITLFENHVNLVKQLLPLDLIALFNVHIREDRFYSGFHRYTLHGGNDFGRRSLIVHYKSILGELLLSRLEALRKSYIPEPKIDPYVWDFSSNLDESVLERYGPGARVLIQSLKDDNGEPDFETRHTVKKNVYSMVKQKLPLFKMIANVDAAKRITGGLIELVRATQLGLSSTAPNQSPVQLFRVSAYMQSYQFADKAGIEYLSTAHLRQSALKMVCTSANCDYAVPFMTIFSKAARCLASDCHTDKAGSTTTLVCKKCQSPLSAYLSAELYLQDDSGLGLTVILSSPELEELIGCTNSQLLYVDPSYEGLCRAFHYAFKTLCPNRTLPFGGANVTDVSSPGTFRPLYDWILEAKCFDKTLNFSQYPNLSNHRIFQAAGLEERGTFFIYHIRGIYLRDHLDDEDDNYNDVDHVQ